MNQESKKRTSPGFGHLWPGCSPLGGSSAGRFRGWSSTVMISSSWESKNILFPQLERSGHLFYCLPIQTIYSDLTSIKRSKSFRVVKFSKTCCETFSNNSVSKKMRILIKIAIEFYVIFVTKGSPIEFELISPYLP